jgi:hypothetical protein
VCNDLDLALALLADLNGIAQVSRTAINLYPVVKELLKCGYIENLVRSRLRSVDDELR